MGDEGRTGTPPLVPSCQCRRPLINITGHCVRCDQPKLAIQPKTPPRTAA